MAIDVKEYAAFTGVTEGYAAEILKDAEHAKWHMPSGAAKLEKAAELMADMEDTEEEEAVKRIIEENLFEFKNAYKKDENGYSLIK